MKDFAAPVDARSTPCWTTPRSPPRGSIACGPGARRSRTTWRSGRRRTPASRHADPTCPGCARPWRAAGAIVKVDAFGRQSLRSRRMQPEGFRVTAAHEAAHWWFRSRRDLFLGQVRRAARELGFPGRALRLLDFGCGTGFNLRFLREFGEVCGADRMRPQDRGFRPRRLPACSTWSATSRVIEGRFDVITSLDVLEHLDDDVDGLRTIGTCWCRVARSWSPSPRTPGSGAARTRSASTAAATPAPRWSPRVGPPASRCVCELLQPHPPAGHGRRGLDAAALRPERARREQPRRCRARGSTRPSYALTVARGPLGGRPAVSAAGRREPPLPLRRRSRLMARTPWRDELPRLRRADIRREEHDEVLACLDSGWLGTGPRVAELEEAFRRYLGGARGRRGQLVHGGPAPRPAGAGPAPRRGGHHDAR